MSDKKTWREKLEEIGGYENEMVSVSAGAVREMINEMEALEEVALHAGRQLRDPSWSKHKRNLKAVLAKLEPPEDKS